MHSTLFSQPELTSTIIWQQLSDLAGKLQTTPIKMLFEQDAKRSQHFSLAVNSLFLDYSKNQITDEVLDALLQLASSRHLAEAIKDLFAGKIFNTTEMRPTLHMALRQATARPEIMAERAKMAEMVGKINADQWLGATGEPITDVVNIGIGGSDLGPVFTTQALAPYKNSSRTIHFISNIDPAPLEQLLLTLNPATTLFIVSSKTFSTLETRENALAAMNWIKIRLSLESDSIGQHFIGVTAAPDKAVEFGILPEHILQFWDWVGGRYSIWSAIGLPLAISIGMAQFEAFLEGASEMDAHFQSASFGQNLPVLLALIGIWNTNFLGADSHAILPYDYRLRCLPEYIQQLDMESNGKSVQQNGEPVRTATGPIIWGQMGTNGQHAFYQLLHQGTHFVPVDFIVTASMSTDLPKHHDALVANCFAQAQALMTGTMGEPDQKPQEVMPGNKPSNMIMVKALTPKTLGALMAMYEHKVFVQGFIWNINSFDQPGVELGKKLATGIIDKLEGKTSSVPSHASTDYLIKQLSVFRKK